MIRRWMTGCCCTLALLFCSSVRAEDGGISVLGMGEVKARPNKVEIGVRITGSGELSNDAIVKFTESRRRTLSAFEKLKITGLKFEELGTSINSASQGVGEEGAIAMPVFPGRGNTPAAKRVTTISRGMKLT